MSEFKKLPTTQSPLVVIVGLTASGKSALAIEIAKKFNGEIICADSRTIYKGMDIGTAKPTNEDRTEVPHHLLDIIEPGQTYSAAQFKNDTLRLIEDITARGHVPIMVGGSGLYIDSVIFDYKFADKNAKRDTKNPRHLISVSEAEDSKNSEQLRSNTLVIGLQRDRKDLKQRVEKRIEKMIENGLVQEVEQLGAKYGWDSEAMSGIGYRFFGQYVRGEINLEEAKTKFVQGDMSLAKRQRTWFRRPIYLKTNSPSKSIIQWVNNSSQAVALVTTFLSK